MLKYIVSESKLDSTIRYLLSQNRIPILDYAVEFNNSKHQVNQFIDKKLELFDKYPNSHHSLKLSSLQFDKYYFTILTKYALSKNIKLLIDAENYEVQDKVNMLTDDLIVNGFDTILYKTYQMYRIDAFDNLCKDIEDFNGCNLVHNIKLVRGAYMIKDYKHNVIFDSKTQTDNCYDNALKMLSKVSENNPYMNVIFATHNQYSFDLIRNNKSKNVYHASLMGMDSRFNDTSSIQKMVHVPFGPFYKTYPYSTRRLYENNFLCNELFIYKEKLLKKLPV